MAEGAPQRVGDYEILRILGAGGMGRVYQVRNVITDRVEAMKVLLPEISGQEQVAARFLREIKVLAALNHPNIAALHTALTLENQLVMIMEYVEGQAISSLLTRGPIPVPDALTYIDQILDALSYAHQRHVIHRDIKPANMMLTPTGFVKLMDFGIAHTEDESSSLTAPGSTLGSMNYMSPEQVKGEKTDERSDLYSLGISLYEMVVGDRPFHGDSSFSLMAAHVNQPPTPPIDLVPELPGGLNDIILTSIAKDAAQRFQSADAFRNAVKVVLRDLQESKTVIQGSRDDTPAGARTPIPPARTGPITRPRPTGGASATGAVAPAAAAATVMQPAAAAAPAPFASGAQPRPAPTPSGGNRGLWVALGAVAVLIVLVAAALYIPRFKQASAADDNAKASKAAVASTTENTPAPAASSTPAPPPAETPAQPAPESTQPAATSAPAGTPAAAPKVVAKNRAAANHASEAAATHALAVQAAAEQQAAAQQAGAAKQKELDEIEHNVDQLTARAAAVNSSVETLQRQQASMGLGLRGDMAEKLGSMRLNLSKAQDAISHGEVDRAKRYATMAESDIEALEKFLGR